MVTVPMPPVEKVRLDELRSSVSHAAEFEQLLVGGVQQRIQQFDRAAVASDNDRALGEKSVEDLAEQVALTEKQLKVAREATKEAYEYKASQQQPQDSRSSQQVRIEVAQAQELRASAEAKIIQEAYQHFVRALSGSDKNDTEGTSEVDQNIAALIKEVKARTEQAKRDLERETARVQASGRVVRQASTAVKWVLADGEGGPLRARREAAQILMEVPHGQAVNIVTIVGAARHGKSFLMNALTGCDDVFPVSPEVHPCTAGADLSPILMPLSDFAQGGGVRESLRQSPSSEPTIALVDMEGQGDKSTEHGVRLATTFLVVSKVVIYNWLSLPNKTTMLQELVMMIKAAEKVVNQEGKRAHAFGHLIILMRDVTDKADEIKAFIMGKEDTDDLSYEAAKDGDERNLIRRGLKKAFESITVHTMPSPHPHIARGAVPLTTVTPEFNTSLGQLRRAIAGHLASPHKFAERDIAGGERINDIVGSLCTAINKTGNICPPSVLDSLDMARAEQEVQRALVNFDAMLGSTFGGHLALTTLETNTALKVAESSAKEQFVAATQAVSDVIKQEAAEKLEQQMSPKAEVVARNQEAKRHELKNRMRAIASQHEADLTEEARSLKVPMEEKALEDQWNILVDSHFVEMKRDIEAMVAINNEVREDLLTELGWNLSRGDFEDLLNDTHKSLQDLNRSAAAGKKDREARVKAEKKMGELAEQAEVFKEEVQVALKKAEQAQAAAEEAQAKAARDAQQQSQSQASAMYAMMAMMGGGGGGGFGGGGAGAYSGAGGGHPGMAGGGYSGMGGGGYAGGGSNLRFYPGGQFVPGGGRSPVGGGYFVVR